MGVRSINISVKYRVYHTSYHARKIPASISQETEINGYGGNREQEV